MTAFSFAIPGGIGAVLAALTFVSLRKDRKSAVDLLVHVVLALVLALFLGYLASRAIDNPGGFTEILVGGLLSGVLYSRRVRASCRR